MSNDGFDFDEENRRHAEWLKQKEQKEEFLRTRVQLNKYRQVRLHNILAQHPLCFSSSLPLITYDVTKKGKIRYQTKNWPVDRSYYGVVLETNKGFYCVGYDREFFVAAIRKREAHLFRLPSNSDRKVLAHILERSAGQRSIEFRSMYYFLKDRGLDNNGTNYRKVRDSLRRWESLCIHFIGDYDLPLENEDSYAVVDFTFISGLDLPMKNKGGSVAIRFSFDLEELVTGGNTTYIDNEIFLRLNSEAALNIYSYLMSFDHELNKWPIKRNLKNFSRLILSSKKSPSRHRNQIEKAVKEINRVVGVEVYNVKFAESKNFPFPELVHFSKGKAGSRKKIGTSKWDL